MEARVLLSAASVTISGVGSPGTVHPGDTITYTETIADTGPVDATGVQFTDSPDPNTTIVPNSVKLSPMAVSHAYDVAGNTLLAVVAAGGLLTGVHDLDGVTPDASLVLTTGVFPTTDSGSVTVSSDGSFSYTPPTGVGNTTDTFSYKVTDTDNLSSTGTVTFNIGPRIWYVDNSASSTGANGTSTHPFTSLAAANAVDGAGDIVYVATGSGAYSTGSGAAGFTLHANEQLIGAGVPLTVTFPDASTATLRAAGTAPSLTNANAGGAGITLSNGDTLAGFTLGGTQSTAIIGSSVAGLTINSVTLSSGASASNDGIRISNLTGTAAVTHSMLSGAFNDVVRITNISGTTSATPINITFDSDTISNTNNPNSTAGLDLDGIEVQTPSGIELPNGSPSVGLTVTNSNLTLARQFLLFTDFNGSTAGNVVLKNDHFSNSLGGSTGGAGVDLSGGSPTSSTAVTYDIENNTFRDSHNSALSIGYTGGSGTWTGRVLNNQVGVSGVAGSGSGTGADGIRIVDAGNNGAGGANGGANDTLVQGNTILNYGEVGLFLSATNGSNTLNATVFGNTMAQPGPAAGGAFAGISGQFRRPRRRHQYRECSHRRCEYRR